MLWNVLSAAASGSANTSSSGSGTGGGGWTSFIPFLLIIAAAIVLFIFSKRSQKKREEEINNTLDAIQPGNKVKTIGGICGVVVEICPEDNTFILETGSEQSGKSYMKLDKKAIYQTDAVASTSAPVAPVEEASAVEGEAPFEEITPVEEAPVTEETPVEEAPTEENQD